MEERNGKVEINWGEFWVLYRKPSGDTLVSAAFDLDRLNESFGQEAAEAWIRYTHFSQFKGREFAVEEVASARLILENAGINVEALINGRKTPRIEDL